MTIYNYSQYCNDKLFFNFPELLNDPKYRETIKEAYEIGKECTVEYPKSGDTSAHGIYEDVFCPFVLDLIQKPDKESRQKLKKALNLIEEIANHEDFNIHNVAYVSFIEKFTHDMEPMRDVEKYLGPKSLEMAREIAHKWFGRNPNTWERE